MLRFNKLVAKSLVFITNSDLFTVASQVIFPSGFDAKHGQSFHHIPSRLKLTAPSFILFFIKEEKKI